MAEREKRSQDELQRVSDHLLYEIGMLTFLAKELALGNCEPWPIGNALLESFVIHLRALLDFLYAENPQKDDVIAKDFFQYPEDWERVRPPQSEILQRARKRVNKEIAHLTYRRLEVNPEEKLWPYQEIANEIKKAIDVFLENVPRDSLGPIWTKNK